MFVSVVLGDTVLTDVLTTLTGFSLFVTIFGGLWLGYLYLFPSSSRPAPVIPAASPTSELPPNATVPKPPETPYTACGYWYVGLRAAVIATIALVVPGFLAIGLFSAYQGLPEGFFTYYLIVLWIILVLLVVSVWAQLTGRCWTARLTITVAFVVMVMSPVLFRSIG